MKPLDTTLYNKIKQLANIKFTEKTSAYKSAWIVKQYKLNGGKYTGKKPKSTGLVRWFKEEWIDLKRPTKSGYAKCGRPNKTGDYPLCRPSKKITKQTPKTYMEISPEILKRVLKLKKDTTPIKFA